jgi:excisionase family DNA binding protein
MSQRLAHTIAEAAQLTSLSVRSIRYLMQTGKLGFSKVGRRVVIPATELQRLLRRTYVKPTQAIDADEPIRPRAKNGNAPSGELEASSRDVLLGGGGVSHDI